MSLQPQSRLITAGCQTDGAGGITIPDGQQGVGANGGWTFTGVTPASGEILLQLDAASDEDRTLFTVVAQSATAPLAVQKSYNATTGALTMTIYSDFGTTAVNLSTTAVDIQVIGARN